MVESFQSSKNFDRKIEWQNNNFKQFQIRTLVNRKRLIGFAASSKETLLYLIYCTYIPFLCTYVPFLCTYILLYLTYCAFSMYLYTIVPFLCTYILLYLYTIVPNLLYLYTFSMNLYSFVPYLLYLYTFSMNLYSISLTNCTYIRFLCT